LTFVSVLRLTVRPGMGDLLVQAFADLAIFERSRASGGFLDGRLLRSLDDSHFLVVARWENEGDYQGWLDNPAREEIGKQLEPLLADEAHPGDLYAEMISDEMT
jgi:heme-degrading monooxygenase HmoA